MTHPSLRRLAAGGALALPRAQAPTLAALALPLAALTLGLAALALAPAAQAQALHPLPPDFLATLGGIDSSSDELAVSVAAIRKADLTYSIFSRRRVEDAIARMEKLLPVLKAQTADLRREESLRMLLSMRGTFSDAQRNISSISDILHGVSVRTPVEADQLDKLLARLDSASARLDAALKQFDSGAMRLAERPAPAATASPATTSPAPATAAQAPAAPGQSATGASASPSARTPASTTPAQRQGLQPLPPAFLATLGAIDTSSGEMAASVAAIKKADLTYSMFSRNRVAAVIARMEKQLPMLKAQTADLRREESLGMLLSMRVAFADAQRDIGSVSDILHGVTVRTPSEADELDKLLARLDAASAHLASALKQFDSGALAMIEQLDKPNVARPAP